MDTYHGKTVKELWKMLGDVPINEDEEIELQFLDFWPGTHREEIWHWFEETFDVSVHDLMFTRDYDGWEGQDRDNYTDTQDRENYTLNE